MVAASAAARRDLFGDRSGAGRRLPVARAAPRCGARVLAVDPRRSIRGSPAIDSCSIFAAARASCGDRGWSASAG